MCKDSTSTQVTLMVSHKLPTEDNNTQLLFDLLYSTDADATTFNWQIISQMNYLENR